MHGLKPALGISNFRKLRENNCFYIDKTAFIEELAETVQSDAMLITRPRRFGKSLTMSMLAEFFNIEKKSMDLFADLAIANNKQLCAEWMNSFPVISLNLKGIEEDSFDKAVRQFARVISLELREHDCLFASAKLSDKQKKELDFIDTVPDDTIFIKSSLQLLCLALAKHFDKQVIVLIDEYDVPLANAQKYGYYEEMRSFIRGFLGNVLKDNIYLKFGIMTGCLCVAKESSYTGLNNLQCYTISDTSFADKIGFTSEDVGKILDNAGLSHKRNEIQAWYDGYCFGDHCDMYCPWDVLQYVDALQKNADAVPQAYWSNTSGNEVVKYCVGCTDPDTEEAVSALLQGESIAVKFNKWVTYDSLADSADNIWTLLYLTGYLTKTKKSRTAAGLDVVLLRIPNREIHGIFSSFISEWARNRVKDTSLRPLFDAIWKADSMAVTEFVSNLLMEAVSYHDYKEAFYHAVLLGLLKSKYIAISNYESGLGRADIIVEDAVHNRAAVIEVKHAPSQADMDKRSEEALQQIQEQKYDARLRTQFKTILHWDIAFHDKSCLAKCQDQVTGR